MLTTLRIESRIELTAVYLGEACCVPKLSRKVPIAFDPAGAEFDVAARAGAGEDREAKGIGAILFDQIQRIDDIALGFRHLLATLIPHQAMDVNVLERHLAHKFEAEHHHPSNPEKDDVEAGHQNIGGIVAIELRRLLRPAEGRERPEAR